MGASSQRRAWLAGGLVLLVLGAFALLWRALGAPEVAAPVEVGRAAPAGDAALAPVLDAPSEPSAGAGASDGFERAAVAKSAESSEATAADSGRESDPLTIDVRDAATDLPVAGAQVLVVSLVPGAEPDWLGLLDDPARIDELLARGSAIERVTDEAGVAFVPRRRDFRRVVARKDGSFGHEAASSESPERVRVEIAPDWPLLIQVVDGAGDGVAGVPVALRLRDEAFHHDLILVRTEGPDGIGRVPHAGACIGRSSPSLVWCAAVAAATRTPLEAVLDRSKPPDGPIRFVLPDTGSVAVKLIDAGGLMCRDNTAVELAFVAADGASGSRAASARAANGVARFDFVELGAEVLVRAFPPYSGAGEVELRAAGPKRAGETVEVAVRFGVEGHVLQARVVRPGGEPVEQKDLRLAYRTASGSLFGVHPIHTDELGRFRFGLLREFAEQPDLSIAVSDRVTGDAAPPIQLARGFVPGLHELGDVVLSQAPLIASGTVVDPTGEPVPRAVMLVFVRPPAGSGDDLWYPMSCHGARSDDAGRFALHGTIDAAGPILVAAQREGYAAGRAECALGTDGLELVLERGSALAGSVLVDRGVPFEGISVALVGRAESADGTWLLQTGGERPLDASGRFEIRDVSAGTHTLSVAVAFAGDVITEIPDIAVAAGEFCRDPRLSPIDLRGRVGAIDLSIVDREGQPAPGGNVIVRSPEGRPSRTLPFENGRVTVLRLEPSVNLEISASGFRTTVIEDVERDQKVVLERGIPVRLVLADASALPTAPFHLSAGLWDRDGERLDVRWPEVEFDERGEVVLGAPAAGSLEVVWMVRRRTSDDVGTCQLECETATVIEVADGTEEQRFEVAFDAEALAAAMRELGD